MWSARRLLSRHRRAPLGTRPSPYGTALGGLLAVALTTTGLSPAWGAVASDAPDAADRAVSSALVEDLSLGGDVTSRIDERTGALSVEFPVGGLTLRWDSHAAAIDRHGLGDGWSWAGLGYVDVTGGVRAFPPTGVAHAADPTTPTGLRGYDVLDVRFDQADGTLAARDDAAVPARDYRFVLAELGGAETFFDHDGNPIARRDAFGTRIDWVWDDRTPHRLTRMVDEVGVVTVVDRSAQGSLRITTTSTVDPADDPPASWVDLDGGRVVALRDAVGGRTALGYSDDGLLERVHTETGAVTEIAWRTLPDGTLAVERARILDGATGELLTAREWHATRGSSSGWPEPGRFATRITDGTTSLDSAYTATGLMTERNLLVSTPSGISLVERHRLEYPGLEDGEQVEPGDPPSRFTRPTTSSITWITDTGAKRSATERSAYDDFGRVTRHEAADGTVTETTYDDAAPEDRPLPIGLRVGERTVAPDGMIEETRYELTDDRAAVAAVERARSAQPGDAPVRTARTEYEIDPDGFVRVEAVFPQGGAGTPVVTERARTIDPAAGTETVAETRAAGTPIAATTTRVTSLVHGAPVAETDPVGATTHLDYDAAGREIARTDAAGVRLETSYRTAGRDGANGSTTIRADGLATTHHLDAIGRLVRVTDNLAAGHPADALGATPEDGRTRLVESRTYPDAVTETVTDAWGAETTTRRDVLGRVVETIRPTGLHELTRFDDAAGTRTTGTSPTGRLEDAPLTTTETLDLRGDVTRSVATRDDGRPALTTERGYDGLGRLRSVHDGITATAVSFDAHDNPATTTIAPEDAVADDLPVTLRRDFDAAGVTVEQVLARGAESRSGGERVVDELGRSIRETDPAGRSTVSEYRADGALARRTASPGQVTEHTYDDSTGRLLETVVTSPVGASVRSRSEYDPVLGQVTAVYDPADRNGTEISFEHDAHGNVTRVAYPDGSVVSHQHDVHGRRTGTTDVAGRVTALEYDVAGRVTAVVQRDQAGIELARAETTFDRLGRVATLTRGNGVVTRFEYTSIGEPAAERTTDASGALVSERAYEYDARGNLLECTELVPAGGPGGRHGEPVERTTTYTYDIHDRLTSSTVVEPRPGVAGADAGDGDGDDTGADTGVEVVSRTDYDSTVSGDLRRERTETRPGRAEATAIERTYSYAPTGELTRIEASTPEGVTVSEPRHDAAGNLVVGVDGTRYTYDAANRPVSETTPDGHIIATRYWADSRRAEIESTDPETPTDGARPATRFYWDGATLLNDVHSTAGDAGADRVASYLLGAARYARTTTAPDGASPPRTEYAVHDRHGNVTALTAADGTVTQRYAYDDYGVASVADRAAPAHAPLRWRVGDADANPFAYAGEYTDPTGTQFLQSRSYHAGMRQFTTSDTEPLHNRYAYADLNPITKVDPTGRASELDGIDWAGVMSEPWFKMLSLALAITLTVVGFFSMTVPFAGANLAIVVGYWGGMATLGIQAAGAALLAADTLNTFVDEPFWETAYAGQIQFAGNVLSSVGAIGGGAFRVVRKVGGDMMKADLFAARAANTDLVLKNETLIGENARLTAANAAHEEEIRTLKAAVESLSRANGTRRTDSTLKAASSGVPPRGGSVGGGGGGSASSSGSLPDIGMLDGVKNLSEVRPLSGIGSW